MISIKETTNKSLTIKGAYMDLDKLVDENGNQLDLYSLLKDTYGDGIQFTIKVSAKVNKDLGS